MRGNGRRCSLIVRRQLPPLALADVIDLIGNVRDIEIRQPARTQERRLFIGPGDDVGLV